MKQTVATDPNYIATAAIDALAAGSHSLRYLLAVCAVVLCFRLFQKQRALGWLLLSAIFLDPLALLFLRAIHHKTLLAYKSVWSDANGIAHVSYHLDFPFLHIVAVIGLWLLLRPESVSVTDAQQPNVSTRE